MAVTSTVVKNACNLLLNNGLDTQGNIKTVSVSIGTLSADGWDASKAMAIADKLENCLTKTAVNISHVQTSYLQQSA